MSMMIGSRGRDVMSVLAMMAATQRPTDDPRITPIVPGIRRESYPGVNGSRAQNHIRHQGARELERRRRRLAK